MSNIEKTSNVSVRKAVITDIEEVYEMIKELTNFEKLPQNLKIDIETLRKDFSDKAFQCLVAQESDGPLVGYSIYCQSYSTWDGKMLHLRDIYVRPEQRGKDVGKKLFLSVLKNGYEAGCKLAFFLVLEWNPAVKFYKKMGAVDITENEKYHIFRIEQENFQELCK